MKKVDELIKICEVMTPRWVKITEDAGGYQMTTYEDLNFIEAAREYFPKLLKAVKELDVYESDDYGSYCNYCDGYEQKDCHKSDCLAVELGLTE